MSRENEYARIQSDWRRRLDLLESSPRGQRVVMLLLSAVRQHYGINAGISEPGVQPFPGKSRKAKTALKLSSPSPAVSASPLQ